MYIHIDLSLLTMLVALGLLFLGAWAFNRFLDRRRNRAIIARRLDGAINGR